VKKRRRVLRAVLIALALLAGVSLLAYALSNDQTDDGSADRPRRTQRVADPGVEAYQGPLGEVRYVPKINSAWLLQRLNDDRATARLRRLRRDRAASLLAQDHANAMAVAGRLSHVPDRDIRPFRDSGDVFQTQFHYRGGSTLKSAEQVFRMIIARRGGRQPARSRAYNRIGVGAARREGNLWVSLIFIRV
jgi:hypothetical protein